MSDSRVSPEDNRTRPKRWRFVRRLALLLILGLTIVIGLNWFENRLVYPGSTADEEWVESPTDEYEEFTTTSADGARIHGRYFPAGEDSDCVVFAHGNGGNLSHRGRIAIELRQTLNVSVALFDYPGYGKSSGSPSEAGCYAAGDAVIDWLMQHKQIPKRRHILFGESLGGGVVSELATRHEHKVLVLTKTFTSLPAVAKRMFPMLPTHTLMSNRFETLRKLPKIHTPVFIAHGTADELVPFQHAEELFAAANEPKALYPMDGQDHNAWLTSDFYSALKEFLKQVQK